ncbi:MAG: hypothetical protein FVQ78_08990 [Solirubrobacterales bacterium]|nr:hypothetical protein [Solirubrobacterales bacterium]
MTKGQLESKHLAELHSLAADAGIRGYRMLRREELIGKLADKPKASKASPPRRRERPAPPPPKPEAREEAAAPRPKRRRRFRRKGRKGVRVRDLLLPPVPGRQAIVYAETRQGCTALLREVAAELSDASKDPDPIALLVDPSPEELADWKREAPQAEIVAAGKARHADDALAQAVSRADGGEDVIFLVDSLSRHAEAFGGASAAKELLDAGQRLARSGNGSLTVVAAVERRRD